MARTLRHLLHLLALWALLATPMAQAAVPAELVFQGYLTDSEGNPVDGPRTIKFTLYPSDMGGSALWTKTVQVDVNGGLLTVLLGGEGLEFPQGLFGEATLWLALKVGNDSEMTPRQPISSVPWAKRAEVAENVPSNQDILNLVATENYLREESDPSVGTLGRAKISCAEGQVPKFLAGVWSCGEDLDLFAGVTCAEDESPVMGADGWYCGPATLLPSVLGGLVITEARELSLPLGCADGKVMKYDGSFGRWKCNNDEGLRQEEDPSVNALGKAVLACGTGQVPKLAGDGTWGCSTDLNDTYEASTGLIREGRLFSVDTGLLDLLYLNEGQSGAVTSSMILDGAVGPADLAETYSLADHDHNEAYAGVVHHHDDAYAALGHDHAGVYSLSNHDHNDSYSALGHIHDGRYYTETEIDAGYAKKAHTHLPTELPSSVVYTNNDQTFMGSNIFSGAQTFSGAVTVGTGATEFKATVKFSNATAPFTVASTTKVEKLNADSVDGLHSSDFATSAHEHDSRYVNEDQAASISTAMLKTMTNRFSIPASMVAMFGTSGMCELTRAAGGGNISQGASIYVARSSTGTCNFYFPLPMPFMSNGRTNTIKSLEVCYYSTSATGQTYISGTYLYAEDSDSVSPLVSDTAARASGSSGCYSLTVDKTLASTRTLALRLSTSHNLSVDRVYISHFVLNLEN